jgi:hypothetical protein
MDKIIDQLKHLVPSVEFIEGNVFCWSPETNSITYESTDDNQFSDALQPKIWALCHEIGHAILSHKTYKTDFELLFMEAEAWDKGKELAEIINASIDEDHIQECLDTYRDWLHKRSRCPTCLSTSLQESATLYRCHNCSTQWRVTSSRFCRPYRTKVYAP